MSRPLFMSERSDEDSDYEYDRRREERAEERAQAELFAKPLDPDVFTLLRLFENHRGIDVEQDWFDLKQHYHGAYDDPASRESWSSQRLSKTLDKAEAAGLVEYGHKWMITRAGLEARKAETVRRMRA